MSSDEAKCFTAGIPLRFWSILKHNIPGDKISQKQLRSEGSDHSPAAPVPRLGRVRMERQTNVCFSLNRLSAHAENTMLFAPGSALRI
jgi:hypothetical protein